MNKIHLNIAGAFSKFHLLGGIILRHQKIEISVYDGLKHEWAGGRVHKYNSKFDTQKLKFYNSRGIKVYIAFSNNICDTSNPEGNKILQILNDTQNGVILCDGALRNLIKERYPKISTIYSITGHSNNINEINYNLESEYDLVVPRFEWIFNKEFLAKANPTKYEVMLNDTCKYGCHLWNDHFSAISTYNRTHIGNPDEIQECWLPKFDPSITSKHECMDLSADAIQKCLNLGYRHFKFSGRENPDSDFISELNAYLTILNERTIND